MCLNAGLGHGYAHNLLISSDTASTLHPSKGVRYRSLNTGSGMSSKQVHMTVCDRKKDTLSSMSRFRCWTKALMFLEMGLLLTLQKVPMVSLKEKKQWINHSPQVGKGGGKTWGVGQNSHSGTGHLQSATQMLMSSTAVPRLVFAGYRENVLTRTK